MLIIGMTCYNSEKYISKDKIIARRCQNYAVEGLFTIGSTGSIAQTADSDIDWWVCIKEECFTSREIELFRKKLDILPGPYKAIAVLEYDGIKKTLEKEFVYGSVKIDIKNIKTGQKLIVNGSEGTVEVK